MIAPNNKQKLYDLLRTGQEYSKETLVKLVSHRFSEYVRQLNKEGIKVVFEHKYGTNWYRLAVPPKVRKPQPKQPGLFDN